MTAKEIIARNGLRRGPYSNGKTNTMVQDGPWLAVIQEATTYAFGAEDEDIRTGYTENSNHHRERGRERKPSLPRWTHAKLERVARSLNYLDELKDVLEEQENWEFVPYPCHPPSFWAEDDDTENNTTNIVHSNSTRTRSESSAKPIKKPMKKNNDNWANSNNPFAIIASDSDSDSDGDSDSDQDDDDDGGEAFEATTKKKGERNSDQGLCPNAKPYNPSNADEEEHGAETMDTSRLLIRLFAAQSDLYAKQARLLATCHCWLPGAGALQSSIVSLAQGLELADASISKTFAMGSNYNRLSHTSSRNRRQKLEADAYIVSLSSNYLVFEKDKYLREAHKQATRLERILKPQWEKRDLARKKVGHQKWKKNSSSSKGYFAKLRERHEAELYALEEALRQLEDAQKDAVWLVDEAGKLNEKLKEIRFAQNRYNGKLHSFWDAEASLPIQYGWTFTGSLEDQDCVEFYEKRFVTSSPKVYISSVANGENAYSNVNNNGEDSKDSSSVQVLLEVHFKTGAIRTVIEYPARYDPFDGSLVQSAWKLPKHFDARGLSEGLYHRVLQNPLLFQGRSSSTVYGDKDGYIE